MAGVSSRPGTRALLRNFKRCISSDSSFAGVFTRLPGENGIVAHEDFRAESIRRAAFDISLPNQHALIGSENSYTNRLASNRVAAPKTQPWTTLSTTGNIKVLSRVKFEVLTSCGRPSQTTCGCFHFNATRSQSTSAGKHGRLTTIQSAADGSGKVVARISNVPKFVFKSDLLLLLKGCNLTPEDLLYIYDSKYRLKFIQIQLSSVESFQLAQRALASKGRFGGRYLKLTSEGFEVDDVNKILAPFRGRSLLMIKVPFGVMTEDVERFFSGYTLDSNYPIKFSRLQVPTTVSSSLPVQVPIGGSQGSTAQMRTDYEMRVLVRFGTELEALRALREKQGTVCLEKLMDLRFIF